jgi:hypothetical protein
MNRVLIAAAAATTLLAAPAMAQSAKFAAVWTDGGTVVESSACASTEAEFCGEMDDFDADLGVTFTYIRVPQAKELLVGVSAQVGLFTQTIVKGKNGSRSVATAAAGAGVLPLACNVATEDCVVGEPGFIVLDARWQELSAVLGGIIEECTVDVTVDPDDGTGSGTFDLADCTVAQEEISLALATLGANHFNFVFPDLPQGDYAIVGLFFTAAEAAAWAECPESSPYCNIGDGAASALSHAFIGKTMRTVEQVRAVKGSLGSMEFEPIDIE